MFDKRSDYAKNKRNADSIIYTDANGEEIHLTRDDFESEEEFRRWKAWSDSQYHETEKSGRSYHDRKLPLFEEEGTYGNEMEEWLNRLDEENRYDELLNLCRKLLTKTQLRRFWLYAVKKMREQEIAELEGVGQQRVYPGRRPEGKCAKVRIGFLFQSGSAVGSRSLGGISTCFGCAWTAGAAAAIAGIALSPLHTAGKTAEPGGAKRVPKRAKPRKRILLNWKCQRVKDRIWEQKTEKRE